MLDLIYKNMYNISFQKARWLFFIAPLYIKNIKKIPDNNIHNWKKLNKRNRLIKWIIVLIKNALN